MPNLPAANPPRFDLGLGSTTAELVVPCGYVAAQSFMDPVALRLTQDRDALAKRLHARPKISAENFGWTVIQSPLTHKQTFRADTPSGAAAARIRRPGLETSVGERGDHVTSPDAKSPGTAHSENTTGQTTTTKRRLQ